MHPRSFIATSFSLLLGLVACHPGPQVVGGTPISFNRTVSHALYNDLEELSRIVDISYCAGTITPGITKPFKCLSFCSGFPNFELIDTWETGLLQFDAAGYIALDHNPAKPKIIVVFRGTYSIENIMTDLDTARASYSDYPGKGKHGSCSDCKVHKGFMNAWRASTDKIVSILSTQKALHPDYDIELAGHSMGGSIAALAGLHLIGLGYDIPTITTFGEAKVGNAAFAHFLDTQFNLQSNKNTNLKYRAVTHINDLVPLLPPKEWSFSGHAGEIYITSSTLPYTASDLQHCYGDNDPTCSASQDGHALLKLLSPLGVQHQQKKKKRFWHQLSSMGHEWKQEAKTKVQKAEGKVATAARTAAGGVVTKAAEKVQEGVDGFLASDKYWGSLTAHRDYFWRMGLCLPGGSPHDWERGSG